MVKKTKVDFTPEPEDLDMKIDDFKDLYIKTDDFTGNIANPYASSNVPARLFHIKVGTKEFPAKEEYIEEVRKEIEELTKGMSCIFFVTPHDVEIATII